jgi:hypothetical protein
MLADGTKAGNDRLAGWTPLYVAEVLSFCNAEPVVKIQLHFATVAAPHVEELNVAKAGEP